MLTAREEVEAVLLAMTPDEYVAFRDHFGGGFNVHEGETQEQAQARDVDKLLHCQHLNPAVWAKLCRRLEIKTDDERQVVAAQEAVLQAAEANQVARRAGRRAWWAIVVSIVSVLIAALALLSD